jgi:predicted nucleic acid-binding protein
LTAAAKDCSRRRGITLTSFIAEALQQALANQPAPRPRPMPTFGAALCIAHGARLATADRGFARFRGLTWFDPAETK